MPIVRRGDLHGSQAVPGILVLQETVPVRVELLVFIRVLLLPPPVLTVFVQLHLTFFLPRIWISSALTQILVFSDPRLKIPIKAL